MPTETQAQVAQYELEIEIKATRDRGWEALTGEIDAWWLPDFRSLGDSVVTLDPVAGGSLIERCEDGRSLLWYGVVNSKWDLRHKINALKISTAKFVRRSRS